MRIILSVLIIVAVFFFSGNFSIRDTVCSAIEATGVSNPADISLPKVFAINETLGASNGAESLPSVTILVEDTVGVADSPQVVPSLSILVEDTIGVADSQQVVPSLSILVEDTIGVADSPQVVPSVSILVEDMIGVADSPQVVPPVLIRVAETLSVIDSPVASPEATSAPVIIQQPIDQTVAPGQIATFTSNGNGIPIPSIQWQLSTSAGKQWSNIPAATSATYTTPPTTSSMDHYQYRVIYNNTIGSITSEAAILYITTAADTKTDAQITQAMPKFDYFSKALTWTLIVTNLSNNPALDVQVNDIITSGTNISSIKVTSGTYKTRSNTVMIYIPKLAKRDSVVITIETLVTTASGTITNTATVTTSNQDSELSNNTSTASFTNK